jgi:hypothetical protein
MAQEGPREWSPRWGLTRRFVLKTELGMAGDIIDWMPEEQECFVIEITPEYAKLLVSRLAIFMTARAADRDLWEMYFYDYSGEYYGIDWGETGDKLDEEGREIVVPRLDAPGSTEVNQIIIREEEVCWTAMPKHSSVYVLTAPIEWNEIRQIAAVKKAK